MRTRGHSAGLGLLSCAGLLALGSVLRAQESASALDPATTERLFALVLETNDAILAGDYDRVRESFDLGALLDAALASAPHPRGRDPFWRWTWTSGFFSGLSEADESSGKLELRGASQDGERGRYALVTRQRGANGVDVYLEWAIEPRGPRGDDLRVVDHCNLDTGTTLSEYVASGIQIDVDERLSYEALEEAVLRGRESASQGELVEAERILREELDLYPPSFAQPLEIAVVQAAITQGDGSFALTLLEEFARRHPRAALTQLLRAQAFSALGQHEELEQELDLYEARIHGPDKTTLFQRALSLQDRGLTADSVAMLGRALDDDPQDVSILAELAAVLPRWDMRLLRQRFLALADAQAFEPLVADLLDREHFDAVECLCRAQLEAHPQDADGLYWLALLHVRLEQYDVAVREAREALEHAPQDELDAFQRLFLDACLGGGTAVAGYEACPERAEAFRYLAQAFRDQGDVESSRALLERHGAFDAADPWLGLYRALLTVDEGAPEKGIELLATLWREASHEELRETLRWYLVDTAYTYKSERAPWRETEPAEESFAQLLATSFAAGDLAFLSRLVQEHFVWKPSDPLQTFYRGLESLLMAKPKRALLELQHASAEVERDGRFVWLHDQALVRAHLRSGDPEQARQRARASQQRDGDPFLPMLATVGGGPREEARAWLSECVRYGYDPYLFYEDPDVGTLLLADEAFEDFRSEYPPPLDER